MLLLGRGTISLTKNVSLLLSFFRESEKGHINPGLHHPVVTVLICIWRSLDLFPEGLYLTAKVWEFDRLQDGLVIFLGQVLRPRTVEHVAGQAQRRQRRHRGQVHVEGGREHCTELKEAI